MAWLGFSSPPPHGKIRSNLWKSERVQLRVSVEAALERPRGQDASDSGVFTLQVGRLVRTHPFILAGPTSRQAATAGWDGTSEAQKLPEQEHTDMLWLLLPLN